MSDHLNGAVSSHAFLSEQSILLVNAVCTEPDLQPLTGEQLYGYSANSQSGVGLDIKKCFTLIYGVLFVLWVSNLNEEEKEKKKKNFADHSPIHL